MNELIAVGAILTILSLAGTVFYLAHRLAITSRENTAMLRDTLDHALAISADNRSFMRDRFDRDLGLAKTKQPPRIPVGHSTDTDIPGITIPVDPETGAPIPVQTYTG